MRLSICPGWSHEGTPSAEALIPMVQLLPPVLFRRNGEFSAKPLIGFKQAPGRMVDVEAVQAGKKGFLCFEVVFKWNPTTGRGAPEGEFKLALPPAEGSVFQDSPCLVCHRNVSSEWGGSNRQRRCPGTWPWSDSPGRRPLFLGWPKRELSSLWNGRLSDILPGY